MTDIEEYVEESSPKNTTNANIDSFHYKFSKNHVHTAVGKVQILEMILPIIGFLSISLYISGPEDIAEYYNQTLNFFYWSILATSLPIFGALPFIFLEFEKLPYWYQYKLLYMDIFLTFILLLCYILPFFQYCMHLLATESHRILVMKVFFSVGMLICMGHGIWTLFVRLDKIENKINREVHESNLSIPL